MHGVITFSWYWFLSMGQCRRGGACRDEEDPVKSPEGLFMFGSNSLSFLYIVSGNFFQQLQMRSDCFPFQDPKLQFSELVSRPAGTLNSSMAWATISHDLLSLLSWPLFYIPNDIPGLLSPNMTLPDNKQLSGLNWVLGTGLASGDTMINIIQFLSSKNISVIRGNRVIDFKITIQHNKCYRELCSKSYGCLATFLNIYSKREFAVFQALLFYCWIVLIHSFIHSFHKSLLNTFCVRHCANTGDIDRVPIFMEFS